MTVGTSWGLRLAPLIVIIAGCTAPVARVDSATSPSAPAASSATSAANPAGSPSVVVPIAADGNPFATLRPMARHWNAQEIHDFLAAAWKAEALPDRMQGCLAYPDPPHSHWSHEVTEAFCHYRLQPIPSASAINALIRQKRTADLDKQLAAAMRAEQTRPLSRGLLDRVYNEDFNDGSENERRLLDAWKKASPRSAFAYTASGVAYVQMAIDARGNKWASETPDSAMQATAHYVALAEADLQQALTLQPGFAPAYVAWLHGANLVGDELAIDTIEQRALAANPSDYSIYTRLLDVRQPKWHGSLAQMQQLALNAQAHAAENPLLRVLPGDVQLYKTQHETSDVAAQLDAYFQIFDQAADAGDLVEAANTAFDNDRGDLTVVLMSEALRFPWDLPNRSHQLSQRSLALSSLGYAARALTDADRAVRLDPHYAVAYSARGAAYETLRDDPHAIAALNQSAALDPSESWPLIELGSIHVRNGQWDQAWATADRIIERFPDLPNGYLLRAQVQISQPRAGLAETYQQLVTRFGNDADYAGPLEAIRDALSRDASAHGATH